MHKKSEISIPGIRNTIKGLTAYQPGKFIEEVQDEFGLDQVIKIASNENPYGPYPQSIVRMKQEVEKLNQYPDANFKSLRHTLGRIHGISPDCISLSHGAEGMLQTIGKCFLSENDEVIIPDATYTLYKEISKVMGAKVVHASMDGDSISLETIEAEVGSKTKLIWLANPNNPTGTTLDPAAFHLFLKRLPAHVWVVLDEAYAEFADADRLPDRASLIREGLSIICVRSFSKAYGLAGARLGYAIASEEMVTVINTVSEPFNANRVAIAGAIAAINEDGAYFTKTVDRIKNDRADTEKKLLGLGLRVIPSQGNFIMFETPMAADDIFNALLRAGVIVRPCTAWGLDRMIRVSIGTPEQMEIFITALSQILDAHDSTKTKVRAG